MASQTIAAPAGAPAWRPRRRPGEPPSIRRCRTAIDSGRRRASGRRIGRDVVVEFVLGYVSGELGARGAEPRVARDLRSGPVWLTEEDVEEVRRRLRDEETERGFWDGDPDAPVDADGLPLIDALADRWQRIAWEVDRVNGPGRSRHLRAYAAAAWRTVAIRPRKPASSSVRARTSRTRARTARPMARRGAARAPGDDDPPGDGDGWQGFARLILADLLGAKGQR